MPAHLPAGAPPTPEQWLTKLSGELARRRPAIKRFDDYYEGEHPLPFLPPQHAEKYRHEFIELLRQSRSNLMELVVDAEGERLKVDGFRLSAATDQAADDRSWEIWQANQMDAQSQVAFTESLVKGISYLSVWKPDGAKYPTIAVEDPAQTIVAYGAGTNYRVRLAALKIWVDEWTARQRATLYLPDQILKFEARGKYGATNGFWTEREAERVPNPWGVVPIVPLRNRPRLLREGRSEIANVITDQDRINSILFYRMMAGYHAAHRQKTLTGFELEEDPPGSGKLKNPFPNLLLDEILIAEGDKAKFGELGGQSLESYIKSIEQDVVLISVKSQTPRHYLIQEGQSPSGDALLSAEAGLTLKSRRAQTWFGEGLEEVMGLARRFDSGAEPTVDSEVVWADPAFRTPNQKVDFVVKLFEAGLVPWEGALEEAGFSQTQIARWRILRRQDQLAQQALDGFLDDDDDAEEAAAA